MCLQSLFMKVKQYLKMLIRVIQKIYAHIINRSVFHNTYNYLDTILINNKKNMKKSQKTIDVFDEKLAKNINVARLNHLDSLQLSLSGKTVFDIGCGVGVLAQFFVEKNCNVFCLDARKENIAELRNRFPDLESDVFDIENEVISRFESRDIVFAYGLLYHLENPLSAIKKMGKICNKILIIETMICDCALPVVRYEREPNSLNQALEGIGCRPSSSFVISALMHSGFEYIYTPKVVPNHKDFIFKIKNNLDECRNGHPIRAVFIGSRYELNNENLQKFEISYK